MQILWRQQEQFFAFQTRGIDSIDHTAEMLRVGPQPRYQGVNELLAPLQVRWFDRHNERIELVKIFVDFLKALNIPSVLRHQGIP